MSGRLLTHEGNSDIKNLSHDDINILLYNRMTRPRTVDLVAAIEHMHLPLSTVAGGMSGSIINSSAVLNTLSAGQDTHAKHASKRPCVTQFSNSHTLQRNASK